MEELLIRKPDNWHAHLRDLALLATIIESFNIYGRVLAIGNLEELIETAMQALGYQSKIEKHNPKFEPVMTIMLTENTTEKTIFDAAKNGIRFVKFIPKGTSTGAKRGLRLDDYSSLFKIFPAIIEADMHFLIHAEQIFDSAGREIKYLRREEQAIPFVAEYHRRFPDLKITVEHASTAAMIKFIRQQNSDNLRATLTLQHGIFTDRDVFDKNGRVINPYNFFLPCAKPEKDRQAVVEAMISHDKHFFGGHDSAAHWKWRKLEGAAGAYFGPAEFARQVEISEKAGGLDTVEDFTSRFGAEYYGFPLNTEKILLCKDKWVLPEEENGIRYCTGGETVQWRIVD